MSIKLGLEALHISSQYITGIERYLQLILQALSSLPNDDISEIVVFGKQDHFFTQFPNIKVSSIVVNEDNLRDCVTQSKIDILHCSFVPPKERLDCKVIYTLHDAGRYIYPELMSPLVSEIHNPRIKRMIEDRECIFTTVSNAARDEIVKTLGINQDIIQVVPLYVSDHLSRWNDFTNDQNIIRELGVEGEYLLSVGCFAPTKNAITIVRAFDKWKKIYGYDSSKLVLVGRVGWDIELEEYIPNVRDVVRLTSITDRQMVALYRNSKATISASLIEGFGLPMLEAASFGSPLLCSDIPVYREILGDYPYYFSPTDTNSLIKLFSTNMPRSLNPTFTTSYTVKQTAEKLKNLYTLP